ncbi:maltose alpha-D-glucosyltransferase [Novispirillum sp. DQ9]|uniref:maltose alpha-D-glucosyltransferase n=1 Tax=Novispirillum sp. DQ9 TaxID=3398612 RepID=UPI003C7DA43B
MPESPNTTPPQALTQEQIADPLWYKDAVIYQLHIKAFFDSTNDGIGTFAGLSAKLDYLVSLGVTAVWLLPFYPSPLRDDGYDIADYRSVNPSYGTVRDFREFVKAAHRRGLKVITEMVINHTSDQHPWFQKARHAKRGSAARNFYVWSDDDKKWPETRIIFCDTETSNWTWDPVAQQYYWHRFFSHQPDLNFDNPRVLEEVQRVMKFWFDMGVDGMRLDAIPYLVERDGTNNENLAETHAIIKKLRAYVDENFEGRMLLGEANQWPEDVLPYFGEGEGDECNMAFHFPLMPRMYMALAQEDRHPITDIMRQTPDIPAKAQWAVFLRNHDELTLEMVTDRERDYLWNYYAAEPRARINMGIRRRLAPLVDNDRRKIELLNSLLMSMPGTPIVYYGDEIGMGDNIYLGDRDGVRTPMQWSPDRNGGFSKANPQKLYLPAVADPVYGFQSVNVEAQQGNPSSLLNWMRRLISVRKNHRSFGRGALRFLYPGNRKVLAYLREFEGETILCVANLSRAAQPVELDLSEFEGRVPLELLGRSVFPPVGELPYFVTLPAYAFYWFLLADETAAPEWHEDYLNPLPEFVTVVTTDGWKGVLSGRGADTLQGQALPAFLPHQRWFGAKGVRIDKTAPATSAIFEAGGQPYLLTTWTVALRGQGTQTYQMPLGMAWESRDFEPLTNLAAQTVAKVRRGPRVGVIYDAAFDDAFAAAFTRAILAGGTLDAGGGRTIRLEPTEAGRKMVLPEDCHAARLGKEQSNTSVRIGEDVVLKIYRRLHTGIHPEIELGRHLTDVAGFANIPPVYGHAVLEAAEGGPETSTALAVLQGFVRNQGDGWSYVMDYLDRFFDEAELPKPQEEEERAPPHAFIETLIHTLGRRTGEMHRAFALPSDDPAFTPEPITDADLADWRAQVHGQAAGAKKALTQAAKATEGARREEIEAVLDDWKTVEARIDTLLTGPVDAVKTRFHGDFHLGQVVLVRDDFYLLDFEGEPARPLTDRRHKHSPLKDVAGMVRSFDYAAWAALFKRAQININAMDALAPHARAWESRMVRAFLDGYGEAVAGVPVRPDDPEAARRLLDAFVLEKSLYEVCYEAANRPDWLRIPLKGVRRVLSEEDR